MPPSYVVPPGWTTEQASGLHNETGEQIVLPRYVNRGVCTHGSAPLRLVFPCLTHLSSPPPLQKKKAEATAMGSGQVRRHSAPGTQDWHRPGRGTPLPPPSYIPAGWSAEQAMARPPPPHTFAMLSRLPHDELTRSMQSRNEQTASLMRPRPASLAGAVASAPQPPSPLVQAIQTEELPRVGFRLGAHVLCV